MRQALLSCEGQGWFPGASCGLALPSRGWMGLVESHQVFQPRRHILRDGSGVDPSPDIGLMATELTSQLALAPAEHGKAEQQPVRRHDLVGPRLRGVFILNTSLGFGAGVERQRVFKMNTVAGPWGPVRQDRSTKAIRQFGNILDQVHLQSIFHAARIGGADANGIRVLLPCDLERR